MSEKCTGGRLSGPGLSGGLSGSLSVEGSRRLRLRRLSSSESDEGDLYRFRGSGFRARALGALGGFRGGSGSESDSTLVRERGSESDSGGSGFRGRALGLALGLGSGSESDSTLVLGGSGSTLALALGGLGGSMGVLGLFKLPLGLPAFRFSGSIY